MTADTITRTGFVMKMKHVDAQQTSNEFDRKNAGDIKWRTVLYLRNIVPSLRRLLLSFISECLGNHGCKAPAGS